MRLLITTPTAVVVDEPDVVAVRAEDESGSFGILDGHADFLTVLTVSVVSWHHADDRQRFCAVRRGVLSVTNGNEVAIATREAIVGDDLARLEQVVLAQFHEALDAERAARTESLQLQMKAIRQIVRYLRPETPAYSEQSHEHQGRRAASRPLRMGWPTLFASSRNAEGFGGRKGSRPWCGSSVKSVSLAGSSSPRL